MPVIAIKDILINLKEIGTYIMVICTIPPDSIYSGLIHFLIIATYYTNILEHVQGAVERDQKRGEADHLEAANDAQWVKDHDDVITSAIMLILNDVFKDHHSNGDGKGWGKGMLELCHLLLLAKNWENASMATNLKRWTAQVRSE